MMYRKTFIFLLFFIFLCFPSLGKAAPGSRTVSKPIEIYMDGKKLNADVSPVILDGRALVPLRVISENLGASVNWNNTAKTVDITTFSGKILLKINDKTAIINGQKVALEVPATIIKGRTMVPLRFIGESLGATVSWDNTRRVVSIARSEPQITDFSYETIDGKPSVVIRGDGLLEYSTVSSTGENQIALDIKGRMLTDKNALYIYDEFVQKALMGSIQENPSATRIVVDTEAGVPFKIYQGQDKKSIIISFVNTLIQAALKDQTREVIVSLATNRPATVDYFLLPNPDRLVLDISNTLLAAKEPKVPDNSFIEKIRMGQFSTNPDVVRVVFDLKSDTNYQVFQDKNNIQVIFSEVNIVKNVSVESETGGTKINVISSGDVGYELKADKQNKKLSIVIPAVALDKSLQGKDRIDVNDGVVDYIELNKIKGSRNYNLEITLTLSLFTSYELMTTPPSSDIELMIYRSPLQNKTIVVDPGHGGSDPGAGAADVQEKNINLDIGLKLKELLEQAGARVLMTREDDIFVNLYTRAGIANEVKADLFISIHNNWAENNAARGTETLYYPDTEKKALALAIQKSIVKSIGLADRGIVERPGLVVTRETRMPSALVEVGFISNSDDRSLLLTDEFRQKAAEGIANGIINYVSGRVD